MKRMKRRFSSRWVEKAAGIDYLKSSEKNHMETAPDCGWSFMWVVLLILDTYTV